MPMEQRCALHQEQVPWKCLLFLLSADCLVSGHVLQQKDAVQTREQTYQMSKWHLDVYISKAVSTWLWHHRSKYPILTIVHPTCLTCVWQNVQLSGLGTDPNYVAACSPTRAVSCRGSEAPKPQASWKLSVVMARRPKAAQG